MSDPWNKDEIRQHPGAKPNGIQPPIAYPPPYGHEGGYRAGALLPEPSNKVAVFVLGLLSVMTIHLGAILGPIALVLSAKGRREIREGRAQKDGLHTAGFVLAIIGTCIGAFLVLMIVFAFVIAGVAATHISGSFHDSKYDRASAEVRQIANGVEAYHAQQGYYPETLKDAEIFANARFASTDPWGRAYGYTVKDGSFEVRSQGRKAGISGDDISYDSKHGRLVYAHGDCGFQSDCAAHAEWDDE
ncbi:MAG: type II secretion system protein GspG [Planctomycetes bacterium]|nr:type II secretion system protein GspG [Planctomycetota bacterium]NUQ35832.1 type II secretion system protein GspG [Planctomycetaceae bacterium]